MSHWPPVHTYAVEHRTDWQPRAAIAFYNQWISEFQCNKKHQCLKHWINFLRQDPQCIVRAAQSSEAWFEFWWHAHNFVSEHHANRPTITLAEAKNLYGW